MYRVVSFPMTFSDPTPVSRSRYFLKVNISKRVAHFVSDSWVSCSVLLTILQ